MDKQYLKGKFMQVLRSGRKSVPWEFIGHHAV
jgi:hypothetical protein